MHEFSLATQIVESVRDYAAAQDAREVRTVRLQIGELAAVALESLQHCYHALVRGTALEHSQLAIERVPARVRCAQCQYAGPPKPWNPKLAAAMLLTLQCPQCGQTAAPTRGQECKIQAVQFGAPAAAAASGPCLAPQ